MLRFATLFICMIFNHFLFGQFSSIVSIEKGTFINTSNLTIDYSLSKKINLQGGINFNLNVAKNDVANYIYNFYPTDFRQSIGADFNLKYNCKELKNGTLNFYFIQRNKLNRTTAKSESITKEIYSSNNFIPVYSPDVFLINDLTVFQHGIGLGFCAKMNEKLKFYADVNGTVMWIDYRISNFKPYSAGNLELFWSSILTIGVEYSFKKKTEY